MAKRLEGVRAHLKSLETACLNETALEPNGDEMGCLCRDDASDHVMHGIADGADLRFVHHHRICLHYDGCAAVELVRGHDHVTAGHAHVAAGGLVQGLLQEQLRVSGEWKVRRGTKEHLLLQ